MVSGCVYMPIPPFPSPCTPQYSKKCINSISPLVHQTILFLTLSPPSFPPALYPSRPPDLQTICGIGSAEIQKSMEALPLARLGIKLENFSAEQR